MVQATNATARSSTTSEGLCESILRAIIYADLFEAPMTPAELHSNLIGVRASPGEVTRCLADDPSIRDRVRQSGDLLHLRERSRLADRRKEEATSADRLIDRNRVLLGRLARIPFLRLLAFSGGTSHKNSTGQPDIDLFVIAAKDRVWTSYAVIVLVARLYRRRSLICANYLVDEDHLRLPFAGDLFTAHQLLHLDPLAGSEMYKKLLRANEWAGAIFPNAQADGRADLMPLSRRDRFIQRGIEAALWPVSPLIEGVLRKVFVRSFRRKAGPIHRSGSSSVMAS